MRFGKYVLTAAAAAMVAGPVMAAPANPAASLSVAQSVRTGASGKHGNKALAGGVIVAVLAVAAVGAGIAVVASDNDNNKSDSN